VAVDIAATTLSLLDRGALQLHPGVRGDRRTRMIVPAATVVGPESWVIVTVGAAAGGRVGDGVVEDSVVDDGDGGRVVMAVDGGTVVVELRTVMPVNGSLL
jgi:hypothetical protein